MKNFLLSVLLIVGGNFAYAANNVPMQIIKEGPGGDIGTYAPLALGTSFRMITNSLSRLLRMTTLLNCVIQTTR